MYEARNSIYCYPNSNVLINKLDIRDGNKLYEYEKRIVSLKLLALQMQGITGNFNMQHFISIHKYLFEDIYDWAGKIRNVDISKKGTQFAKAKEIEELASACFSRLKSENYFMNQDFKPFVNNIVDFYCVTNILHPFREGNGRTQRIFISQLIRHAGYEIEFSKISADDLMSATIKAANGVNDYLKDIFTKVIKVN